MKRMLALGIAVLIGGGAAWLLACGPFTTDLQPVTSRGPADTSRYAKGDLGVVRPNFSLGYLLQAYRTLTPRSPARDAAINAPDASASTNFLPDPVGAWAKSSTTLLGLAAAASAQTLDRQNRHVPGDDYQTFLNCPDDAFARALRTLEARGERFGVDSAQVRDWARAQTAVFDNCHDGPLVLPEQPPADADALIRADRAYQTAAAYFYAMQYEEAARRFRAIGTGGTSPWRPFGRYLAARANIRLATVPAQEGRYDRDRLLVAETDLRAVLADASALPLHRSARGLLGFISARVHPIERLHELSARLTAPAAPDDDDVYDYRFILNGVSDSRLSSFSRSDVVRGDDLSDWLLTMGGGGEGVADHALERWRADKTPHWLAAALWYVRGPHAEADALLDAARLLPRRSPAFPTVAFLRIRLLTALGRAPEARAVLAALPSRPASGFSAETINLLKAERLMLAENLDQFLANAPRAVVVQWTDPNRIPGNRDALVHRSHAEPVFDEDAATILAEQFPLTQLVDAALSTRLPPRLRLRVAMAAFTRAIVLRRDEAGARLVPLLRNLAPALGADLDRYARAANAADRYRAGVLLLLNTPGATVDIRGLEDDYWFELTEPAREFDHLFRRNWWCEANQRFHHPSAMNRPSEVLGLLHDEKSVAPPPFVTAALRDDAERERRAILAAGPPAVFLARAAILLATERPADPAGAVALARVVDGWRWTCHAGDKSTTPLPQQAFATLHRLFPKSDAAQRTKYWYRD
jgi:hypothetical protein